MGVNTLSKGVLQINKQAIGARVKISYYYEDEEHAVSANEFRGDARLNIYPKNRFYGFPTFGYEHSLLRLHDVRLYGGIGGAYRLIKKKILNYYPTFNYCMNILIIWHHLLLGKIPFLKGLVFVVK